MAFIAEETVHRNEIRPGRPSKGVCITFHRQICRKEKSGIARILGHFRIDCNIFEVSGVRLFCLTASRLERNS